MTSIADTWGTTEDERHMEFPCDGISEALDHDYYRAVTIDAPAEVVFRWLCQMRVAPYSYDWLDNFGRQSPRQLIAGLDELEVGQSVMTIFEIASFEPNRHITVVPKRGPLGTLLGDGAISYVVVPNADNTSCRLVVKLALRYPPRVVSWPMRVLLPWVDLVMMRRQLLNFKELAEQSN